MIDFEYLVKRSKRKSYEIVIYPNGAVVVLCPKEATDNDIERVLARDAESIKKSLSRIPDKPARTKSILNDADVARLKSEAKDLLPGRVAHFSAIMGVKPDEVQITSAQKRLACCILRFDSQSKALRKSKICFSYRVMLLPEELRDFVVLHELTHMLELGHTPEFFAVLAKYEPNYLRLGEMVKHSEMVLPVYKKK